MEEYYNVELLEGLLKAHAVKYVLVDEADEAFFVLVPLDEFSRAYELIFEFHVLTDVCLFGVVHEDIRGLYPYYKYIGPLDLRQHGRVHYGEELYAESGWDLEDGAYLFVPEEELEDVIKPEYWYNAAPQSIEDLEVEPWGGGYVRVKFDLVYSPPDRQYTCGWGIFMPRKFLADHLYADMTVFCGEDQLWRAPEEPEVDPSNLLFKFN